MTGFYRDAVCLNVLAGSKDNARDIYQAANGMALVGVLSSSYPDLPSASADLQDYLRILNGNLSIGLGNGNPNQWRMVGDLAKTVKADHFNQVFTGVGYTRAHLGNDEAIINTLVSPSGQLGYVRISTGPLSSIAEQAAVIPIETAILMSKDMGGSSIKFFPMGGLKCKDELIAVAQACAKLDFMLEPTGGIDLQNFTEIMQTILNCGVKHVIPHVYSSIIDKHTGLTRVTDVEELFNLLAAII